MLFIIENELPIHTHTHSNLGLVSNCFELEAAVRHQDIGKIGLDGKSPEASDEKNKRRRDMLKIKSAPCSPNALGLLVRY